MSESRKAERVDVLHAGPCVCAVAVVTLPDRNVPLLETRLVRVRLGNDASGDSVSMRFGPRRAARLLVALERAIAQAWPEDAREGSDDDGDDDGDVRVEGEGAST